MKQKALFRVPPAPVRPTVVRDGCAIVVVIPGLRLVSEANCHEHWRVVAKRTKAQKATVDMVLRSLIATPLRPPVEVVITRTAPGRLDDDNLQGAGKHVRDAVAKWIGIDDGSRDFRCRVEQASAGRGVYAVTIRITPMVETETQLCGRWAEVLG